jgi:hypothetical protein
MEWVTDLQGRMAWRDGWQGWSAGADAGASLVVCCLLTSSPHCRLLPPCLQVAELLLYPQTA